MDKIDKLKKLLELSQNDTITPKEVEQFLTMVLGFIKKSKDSFDALSAENIQTIKDCVAYLEDYNKKHTDTIDAKINVATGQMEGKMSELRALIEKVKTLKPKDGKDGVNPDPEDVVPLVLAKLPKAEPFTVKRDEVVREINTGKKDDIKIELQQIEGVDKLEKGVIDRAVSILDQRTKFLVNKSVKHDATMTGSGTDADPLSVVGGGGAVESVNGATGVVVLDADDIDDTSTTNKFVTATDVTNLSNLSGTNTGDQDLSGYLTSATAASTYEPIKGADDNFVTDAEKTKLSNISITQAVDLDALETASHAAVTLAGEDYLSLSTQQITANPIDLDNLSATGTPSSSTFLRGDNTWATPAGSGDVSKVGTPVNDQIAIWTGDGTIEGSNNLQFDGSTMAVTGNVTVDDEAYGPSWDASIQVPTKNALYDKIESISGGATAFTGLTDVPSSYNTGDAGKYVKVNATEDGLEFVAGGSGSGITRTITTSSGATDGWS